MKKTIKLTESDLIKVIKRIINEQEIDTEDDYQDYEDDKEYFVIVNKNPDLNRENILRYGEILYGEYGSESNDIIFKSKLKNATIFDNEKEANRVLKGLKYAYSLRRLEEKEPNVVLGIESFFKSEHPELFVQYDPKYLKSKSVPTRYDIGNKKPGLDFYDRG